MAFAATDVFDDIPQPAKDVLAGGGAFAILGLFARWFLRMLSRDHVGKAGDRSEETQIGRLEREIQRQTDRADRESTRADLAFKERNEAIEKGARAIGAVELLRARVEELEKEIRALNELLQSWYIKPPDLKP